MVAPAEYKALPRTRNRAHGFRRTDAAALRRARNSDADAVERARI